MELVEDFSLRNTKLSITCKLCQIQEGGFKTSATFCIEHINTSQDVEDIKYS